MSYFGLPGSAERKIRAEGDRDFAHCGKLPPPEHSSPLLPIRRFSRAGGFAGECVKGRPLCARGSSLPVAHSRFLIRFVKPAVGLTDIFGQPSKLAKMFLAGLYARVSTNDQQTLPMENRALRDYVARRGWTIARAGETGLKSCYGQS